MEVEVDAKLVLSRRIKLRQIDGESLAGDLRVYESDDPYVLVLTVSMEREDDLRVDVFQEDLARELKAWLAGKYIRYPAAVVPVRIDEAVMKFVKFARPPKQEDLILWILSRCELYPRSLSSAVPELVFGGRTLEEVDEKLTETRLGLKNEFAKTATIAAALSARDNTRYRTQQRERESDAEREGEREEVPHNTTTQLLLAKTSDTHTHTQAKNRSRSLSANGRMTNKSVASSSSQAVVPPSPPPRYEDLHTHTHADADDSNNTFALTKQLIGESATLSALRTKRIPGREGAKRALTTNSWSTEHWRLFQEIERTRKDIEERMDERRRRIAIAQTRQQQQIERLRSVREKLSEKESSAAFLTQAKEELQNLRKIEAEIVEDMRRQQSRTQREKARTAWTMAPSGFANLRGTMSSKGPVLGDGPLPLACTTSQKNPALEETMRRYYWDSAGRRHVVQSRGRGGRDEEESLVELAMVAIRKAAANVLSYKLDLRRVFEEFDSSGDGFLSPMEMARGFLAMGVQLDVPTMNTIFRFFDPNDSGSVHYGEFVWAFYNRRGLVRQWKRKTEGLSRNKILSIFHAADRNGNGRLSAKEFERCLLKELKMELSKEDMRILRERFDLDGDGEIDIDEFFLFIESEQRNFDASSSSATSHRSLSARESMERSLPRTLSLTRSVSPSLAASRAKDEKPVSGRDKERAREGERGKESKSRERRLSSTSSRERGRETDRERERDALPRREKIDFNSTAPAALQTLSISDAVPDHCEPEDAHTLTEGSVSNGDKRTVLVADSSHSEEKDHSPPLSKDVDVLWMSRMLQAQAEIEARLGRRYYKHELS